MSAADACGNTSTGAFRVTVYSSIDVLVFYDKNADGFQQPGEPGVSGFRTTLNAGTPRYTGAGGTLTYLNLLPGSQTVAVTMPSGTWIPMSTTLGF